MPKQQCHIAISFPENDVQLDFTAASDAACEFAAAANSGGWVIVRIDGDMRKATKQLPCARLWGDSS